MIEMRERFRRIDEVEVPDLWPQIVRREPSGRDPVPDRSGRRLIAGLVAAAVAVASGWFVMRAFEPAPERASVGPGPNETRAEVQGVGITWPNDWTLVQLVGEVDGSWPTLQLSNFQPSLDETFCPGRAQLPADGVVLYVQRDPGVDPATLPSWPVSLEPDQVQEGPCGIGTPAAWSASGASFSAMAVVGPEAAPSDVDRLLRVFASMGFGERELAVEWHQPRERDEGALQPFFERPSYVGWGVHALEPDSRTWFVTATPVSPEGGWVTAYAGIGIGGSVHDPKPGEHFIPEGNAQRAGALVQSWALVTPDVARVELRADDGRIIEGSIGPSFARFGQDIRPVHVEFEAPLVGHFVALDAAGNELDREPMRDYPPEAAPQAEPSFSEGPHRPGNLLATLIDGSREYSLLSVDPATGGAVILRTGDGLIAEATASPDGRSIAVAIYHLEGDRPFAIATMTPDGSGYRELASFGREIVGFGGIEWSPDGSSIAFTTFDPPDGAGEYRESDIVNDLYVVPADGGPVVQVTEADHIAGFSWSPEGDRFVISRERAEGDRLLYDLFVIGNDGADLGRLTDDGLATDPAWSANGQIAFVGSANGGFKDRDLFVIEADGTGRRQLTDTPAPEGTLAWSPDATRIAFVRYGGGGCGVWIASLDDADQALVADERSLSGCPVGLDW